MGDSQRTTSNIHDLLTTTTTTTQSPSFHALITTASLPPRMLHDIDE